MKEKLLVGVLALGACGLRYDGPQETLLSGEEGSPFELHSGDLDRDGDVDLLVEQDFFDNISGLELRIFLNQGDGSLVEGEGIPLEENQFQIGLADLNGDGASDLVLRNEESFFPSEVLLNRGDGTFGGGSFFDTEESTQDATGVTTRLLVGNFSFGDIDNDGDLDMVSPTEVRADQDGFEVTVLFNDGTGAFTARQSFGFSEKLDLVQLGDFNADGLLDIVASEALGGSPLQLFVNQGAGSFAGSLVIPVGPLDDPGNFVQNDNRTLASADLDGDQDLDLIIRDQNALDAPSPVARITILRNQGSGAFTEEVLIEIKENFSGQKLLTQDLNGDGAIDIFTADAGRNRFFAFLNEGGGFSKDRLRLDLKGIGLSTTTTIAEDFSGDGISDLAMLGLSALGDRLLLFIAR